MESIQKQFDSCFRDLLIEAGLCPAAGVGTERRKRGLKRRGQESNSLRQRPKLLVGVSGGVDSLCLAHLLLHSSVPSLIIVAHCNFHLRGEESDGDEALVREFCAANGVEFCKTDFDTALYAASNGLSIEIAARELRYEWFGKLCNERGCDALVVAHNANDNAETLFLNLLRGTGLRGLCGMRPLSVVPAGGVASRVSKSVATTSSRACEPTCEPTSGPAAVAEPTSEPATGFAFEPTFAREGRQIPLLRPLLGFSREQIEDYARTNNILWREDSTNAVNDCRRNILRNEVFPLLAEINPSFVRTLNREMQYFTDADDLVESLVPDLLHDGRIDIEELLGYGNWRLFLFHLLRPFNFNSAVIDDIAEHLPSCDGNRIFHSPTHRLQITSRDLLISELAKTVSPDTYIYKEGTYKIEGGTLKEVINEPTKTGETTAKAAERQDEGRTIKIEIIPREALTDLKAPRGTTYLDADKVKFPFMIRGWRHGDWFRPLGMGGATKKVSDLFVDLKYSLADKEAALFLSLPVDAISLPVVAEGNPTPPSYEETSLRAAAEGNPTPPDPAEASHVLALLGERVDDSVKVAPSTTTILKIIIQ